MLHPFHGTRHRGFTLLELMLVIGILAVLASIVIVAINPTKQLASTRDARRRSDITTILNAVYQYAIDHAGVVPPGIPSNAAARGICKVTAASCVGGVNLNVLTGAYLINLPVDPKAASNGTGTEYYIRQDNGGRITVSAPLQENSSDITTTR
jgi:prepilin-type N-terminal cleavage/methylation domain-containing protein